jgi:4-amino-4-deoxy-L-arabinose transferase-like glycosyltransferase
VTGAKVAVSVLRAAAVAVGLGYMLLYVGLACLRVPYRYDLEWLESGMAHEVQRLLHGLPIYTAPTIEYTPFLYPPLFFYLSLPFAALLGPSFTALRVVSTLASLGVFALLYATARRETGDRGAGLLAAGLYAATFRLGGAWFDLARVDSLVLMFMLGAFHVARFQRSARDAVLLGLFVSAAFLTKQSSAVVIGPIVAHGVVSNGRRGLLTLATAALLLGPLTWALSAMSDGWYWYYLFEITTVSGINEPVWVGFWTNDVIGRTAIAFVLTLLALGAEIGRGEPRRWSLYASVTVGVLVMCWASRLHVGGYDNVLMPVYAWLSLMAAIGSVRIGEWARARRHEHDFGTEAMVQLLVLVQFALLAYDPRAQLPTAADKAAGDRILELISRTDGPVFMPFHSYLPALAGKEVYANRSGIKGILDDESHPQRAKLSKSLNEALTSRYFSLVIVDNNTVFDKELQEHYTRIPFVYEDNDTFIPVTGVRTRPMRFCVPKS